MHKKLGGKFFSEIFSRRGPSHHNTGRSRDDKSGDLSDQTVTNGESRISLSRLTCPHIFLDNSDEQTTDNINQGDDYSSYCVAAYKFAGTVHRSIKIGFSFNIFST